MIGASKGDSWQLQTTPAESLHLHTRLGLCKRFVTPKSILISQGRSARALIAVSSWSARRRRGSSRSVGAKSGVRGTSSCPPESRQVVEPRLGPVVRHRQVQPCPAVLRQSHAGGLTDSSVKEHGAKYGVLVEPVARTTSPSHARRSCQFIWGETCFSHRSGACRLQLRYHVGLTSGGVSLY